MTPAAVAIITAFAVGLIGFLLVAALHLEGPWSWVAVVVVGAVAGLMSRRVVGLLGLVAGIVATYPIALWLGVFVFLGELWEVVLILSATLAAAGFLVAFVVLRVTSRGALDP